jgi:hypothetical protein
MASSSKGEVNYEAMAATLRAERAAKTAAKKQSATAKKKPSGSKYGMDATEVDELWQGFEEDNFCSLGPAELVALGKYMGLTLPLKFVAKTKEWGYAEKSIYARIIHDHMFEKLGLTKTDDGDDSESEESGGDEGGEVGPSRVGGVGFAVLCQVVCLTLSMLVSFLSRGRCGCHRAGGVVDGHAVR